MKTEALLTELTALATQHRQFAETLLTRTDAELNYRQQPASWSVLECLEHLNLYGNFYLPEIENRIRAGKPQPNAEFHSGWLGNYFAQSMLPKAKLNKMKTFKNMNPINRVLNKSVLETFIHQQIKLLELLNESRQVDLSRVKTSISITNLIRLRLGDTFRVVIYHQVRHIKQANDVLLSSTNHASKREIVL
ncbi:MAG: DinB family protein [Cyclobacteriaceae bacterium]|nr:DinB family protein [Cyclobacteriaceae bacterium]